MEESKKISFGFSKLVKPKVPLISNKKVINDDKQYIDCVEDKSIKVKNEQPQKSEVLVIPLQKHSSSSVKNFNLLNKIIGGGLNDESKVDDVNTKQLPNVCNTQINENSVKTLDELAAKEIIDDLKKDKNEDEMQNNVSVPLVNNNLGEKESTLEDYESIPIEKFGMAMLRGMGWAPGKGIGKNDEIALVKKQVLRPKGLGLGADKVIQSNKTAENIESALKLIKGSFVRVLAGAHKDLFGKVIGFDDENGRLIIEMALGGSVLTFNEFMVQAISKSDYDKNSRVINVKKFEEYKTKVDSRGVFISGGLTKVSSKISVEKIKETSKSGEKITDQLKRNRYSSDESATKSSDNEKISNFSKKQSSDSKYSYQDFNYKSRKENNKLDNDYSTHSKYSSKDYAKSLKEKHKTDSYDPCSRNKYSSKDYYQKSRNEGTDSDNSSSDSSIECYSSKKKKHRRNSSVSSDSSSSSYSKSKKISSRNTKKSSKKSKRSRSYERSSKSHSSRHKKTKKSKK